MYMWQETSWPDRGVCSGPVALRGVRCHWPPAAACSTRSPSSRTPTTTGWRWAEIGPETGFACWILLANHLAFDPVAVLPSAGRVDVCARSVCGDLSGLS